MIRELDDSDFVGQDQRRHGVTFGAAEPLAALAFFAQDFLDLLGQLPVPSLVEHRHSKA